MVTTSKTIDKDAFGIPAGLHLHNPNEQFRETCHEGYAADLREILENYSPWGKPGGGAPCPATLRKKNVLLEPLEPVKSHMAGQKSHFSFISYLLRISTFVSEPQKNS
ncbi:centrosome and spindle pole-associated protein 1-like isoform X2 [Vespula squamosa]|uniref:Centrosome and spindle pole-associated protein 1-like isoform X2 n=1 Tax=Vespula squamosa TaxID=30214 RepID=A0ABD2AIM7_VESSQ